MEDFTPLTLKVGDVCTVINLAIKYVYPFKIKKIEQDATRSVLRVTTEDDLLVYFNPYVSIRLNGRGDHFHQGAMHSFVCKGNDKSLLVKIVRKHIKQIVNLPGYNLGDPYNAFKQIVNKIKQLP